MKPKHTPGPWKFEPEKKSPLGHIAGRGPTVRLGNGRSIILSYDATHAPEAEAESEAIANAKLIAAAPDMLSALESLLKEIEEEGISDRFTRGLSKLEYAISKAKGSEK